MTPKHLLSLLCALILSAPALARTGLPFDIEPGPPTRVMGCNVAPLLAVFPPAPPEEVEDANACLNAALQNLSAELMQPRIDGLEQQIAALQAQLDSAARTTGGGRVPLPVMSRRGPALPPFSQLLAGVPFDEVGQCLNARGVDLLQIVGDAAGDPLAFSEYVVSTWSTLFTQNARSLNRLHQQLFGGGPVPTSQQMVDAIMQSYGRLANRNPVTACSWALTQPMREQIGTLSASLLDSASDSYNATMQAVVLPAAYQSTTNALRPLFEQITQVASATARTGAQVAGGAAHRGARGAAQLVPEHVSDIMFDVAHRYLLNPRAMATAKGDLETLSGAINRSPRQVPERLSAATRSLDRLMIFNDKTAAYIMIDTLRIQGHAIIDAQGQLAVDQFFALQHAGKDLAISLVTTIPAFAAQPADVVVETVSGVISSGLDMIKPAAQWAIVALLHEGLDRSLDSARTAIRNGQAPSQVVASAGPLGEMLRFFPSEEDLVRYASPRLAQLQSMLADYHLAVKGLASAAAAAEGATAQRASRVAVPVMESRKKTLQKTAEEQKRSR